MRNSRCYPLQGVPRYLKELRLDLTAEANIQRLCFDAEGILFREFDQIYHDLFQKQGTFYKEIVEHLIDSPLSCTELAVKLKNQEEVILVMFFCN